MRPVGIREMFCQALVKLVMRVLGYHMKTDCGNIQLCTSLEAGTERATRAVFERRS